MERSIGATDLRQRLTDVLQAVRERGETYIVETFGRPQVAIINLGQFLLALELYPMEVRALAARFSHDVLADIQATVPLEPETAARVAEALTIA